MAGVDEVGRGAWAGPLVAGAIVMPQKPRVYGVRDSKKLSPKKREELAVKLMDTAIGWALGIVDNEELDRIGIGPSNELAMRRAVEGLPVEADFVLIDAFKIVGLPAKQTAIPHGDAMIYSIAAASIIAKVARDKMMVNYHKQYPEYGFDAHKGYGTERHQLALDTHGMTQIHRASFHPMKRMI